MYKTKTYEIKSCDDIELNIKRDSLLEFKVSYDDKKEMKALFFFINGIRDSDYASYEDHLAEFVVKEFNVAVIRVEYHCIGLRPQTGAQTYMDKTDKEIFKQVIKKLENRFMTSIGVAEYLFDDAILDQDKVAEIINDIDYIVYTLKHQGRASQNYAAVLSLSLQPTKNEYQNFGVMQALDILNALCHIKNNPPFALIKDYKTLLFGTSHGGYLALLSAKFAPWLIDAIVENSGYANVPFRMLGCGKYINYLECFEAVHQFNDNVWATLSTKTHFTLDKNSPHCYTDAHDKIRSLTEKDHLEIQAQYHKPIYISYHSAQDVNIALPQPKERLFQMLQSLGFDATLHMIKDESEVDGQFIKNLEHGMNMSLKTLIQKELPPLLDLQYTHHNNDNDHKEIVYPSEHLEYCFSEIAGGGGIDLKIRQREDKKGQGNV